MEGDRGNTILVAGDQYAIPEFSESFMEQFTAIEVACNLVGHQWEKFATTDTHMVCGHCFKVKLIEDKFRPF